MDVKELMTNITDSHQRTVFSRHLSLLLTVNKNFNHIVELEQLLDLYNSWKLDTTWINEGSIYDYTYVMVAMELIVKTTINSHYNYRLHTLKEFQDPNNHVEEVVRVYFPDIMSYHKYYKKQVIE